MAYGILDIPPWYLCIFLGIQHFLTALGGLVAVPLILAKDLCLQHDPLTQSYLISTTFFVSGICTLLQVLLGIRETSQMDTAGSSHRGQSETLTRKKEGLCGGHALIMDLKHVQSM
ncbi:PREDICTED: solute carrier family 23 member 2-like isoform X1 [Bison bison bison]|uniref:Solute carrier family 23 member 2-like isoform X1 n=2 Tax=Bovinae TaxID=27592 RepID=A0A6P3H902_BISBB|nr:PREDICTED: solute carrier family 23 member 2-like isoform X1 [Bison bison bison]